MRKGWFFLGCLLLLLSGCAGTPQSREAGSTAIVGVLGVEPKQDGIQVFAAAEGREGEDPAMYRSWGETTAAAVEELTSSGDRIVSCAHVEHLLLTENGAEALPEVLSYAFQVPQQSTETQLWMVRGNSLSGSFSGDSDPARRMSVLKAAGKDRAGFSPVTLREAASALAGGEALLIPGLEESEQGLSYLGLALYRKGEVLEWLTGSSALGASLLKGDRVHWTGSLGKGSMSLQSTGCRVVPLFQKGTLTGLSIHCALEGVATGGWDGVEDTHVLEQETARAMEEALAVMQRVGTDGAGLKERAGLNWPLQWQRLSSQWEEAFPNLDAEVSVTITIAERQ